MIVDAVLAGNVTAASEAMLAHIAGSVRDFTDMLAHVPTRLLATDADYPGRQSQEQDRETVRRSLGQGKARQGKARQGKARQG